MDINIIYTIAINNKGLNESSNSTYLYWSPENL